MTPEEITTLFATAATSIQPIIGQPTDDDLTAIREILYPLLLSIPYDENGTHNLIGILEPEATYATMHLKMQLTSKLPLKDVETRPRG